MKRYICSIIILLFLSSCDIIPEKERTIPNDEIAQERVVLLEDYTGQKCINCPLAAEEVEELLKVYKDNLLVVSVHAGGFALRNMKTEAGEAYNTHFKIESYPKGIVNRTKYNDNLLLEYSQWGQAIRASIWKKSGLQIDFSGSYNEKDSLLNIMVDVEKDKSLLNEKLSLQLWLIENDIKGVQLMPDGSRNRDYIHHHVLRDAMNGIWGQELVFDSNNTKLRTTLAPYSLKQRGWHPEHCEVVAFVFLSNTYEILEASKIKLKKL